MIGSPLAGLMFRVTSPLYRDLDHTALVSLSYPGRFNTTTLGAVYASREPDTAAEEMRRRVERDGMCVSDLHPRCVLVLDLALQSVVDLTPPHALAAWDLVPADLRSADFARCQDVATRAAGLGAEGIRWASATGAGHSVALFIRDLKPGSRINLREEYPLSRHDLTAIESGARLTDLIPALAALPLL